MNLEAIKLIIWDLDNTFWNGVLSEEGSITIIEDNITIVKRLAERGIISSICSKNDHNKAEQVLKNNKVDNFFVFKSINWDAKGPRVNEIIQKMKLTQSSVLFIDDNPSNLAEVQFYSPDINVALPNIINEIGSNINIIGKDDKDLTRLKQYQKLEIKYIDSQRFNNSNSFLKQSKITISINEDCDNNIERIHELILRTNQLNYTKRRLSKEELVQMIRDRNYKTAYIKCSDKYGDYGIIGFFSFLQPENRLIDFLFSCRTMGMGIESFVYNYLNSPKIEIKAPVATQLEHGDLINYITIKNAKTSNKKKTITKHKIFLRGPCDLDALLFYLDNEDAVAELAYVGTHGESLYQIGHSQVVLDSYNYTSLESPFAEDEMYSTKLYKDKYDLVILSVLAEAEYGIYENDKGERIIYGECYRPAFLQQELNDYQNGFHGLSKSDFVDLEKRYKFLGRISIEESIANYEKIINLLPKETKICILLGPTKPVKNERNYSIKYLNGEEFYKKLNNELTKLQKKHNNLYLIEPIVKTEKNSFYASKSSTHYPRKTYYYMAKQIDRLSNSIVKSTYKKEALYLFKKSFLVKILVKIKRFLRNF